MGRRNNIPLTGRFVPLFELLRVINIRTRITLTCKETKMNILVTHKD